MTSFLRLQRVWPNSYGMAQALSSAMSWPERHGHCQQSNAVNEHKRREHEPERTPARWKRDNELRGPDAEVLGVETSGSMELARYGAGSSVIGSR